MALLDISDVRAGYGEVEILHGVSMHVDKGECVTVLGANAAGKSTLLRTLSGLTTFISGSIQMEEQSIHDAHPQRRVLDGLVHVPEGRLVFPFLSVDENLRLGAFNKNARATRAENLERVRELFPILAERQGQLAGSLSGGEQQMLALGRGLMSNPSVLMLDEPSLGLAPVMVDRVLESVRQVHRDGMTVLIVEQNAEYALDLADRAYVLENGEIVMDGPSDEVRKDDGLRKAYLGL